MTRLEEIEARFNLVLVGEGVVSREDRRWLISEVKRLRAALNRTRVALAPFADGNSSSPCHKQAYDVLQEQP